MQLEYAWKKVGTWWPSYVRILFFLLVHSPEEPKHSHHLQTPGTRIPTRRKSQVGGLSSSPHSRLVITFCCSRTSVVSNSCQHTKASSCVCGKGSSTATGAGKRKQVLSRNVRWALCWVFYTSWVSIPSFQIYVSFYLKLFFLVAPCLCRSARALCCCTQAFSGCGKQELLSSCSSRASHCGCFSCCRVWALGHTWPTVVVAQGLNCSSACGILIPWPGIEPESPGLAGRFLTTGPPGKSP